MHADQYMNDNPTTHHISGDLNVLSHPHDSNLLIGIQKFTNSLASVLGTNDFRANKDGAKSIQYLKLFLQFHSASNGCVQLPTDVCYLCLKV